MKGRWRRLRLRLLLKDSQSGAGTWSRRDLHLDQRPDMRQESGAGLGARRDLQTFSAVSGLIGTLGFCTLRVPFSDISAQSVVVEPIDIMNKVRVVWTCACVYVCMCVSVSVCVCVRVRVRVDVHTCMLDLCFVFCAFVLI